MLTSIKLKETKLFKFNLAILLLYYIKHVYIKLNLVKINYLC